MPVLEVPMSKLQRQCRNGGVRGSDPSVPVDIQSATGKAANRWPDGKPINKG
jgi:hypothetical protein